nr:hypothetical protein [Deltaproteobacteria bacterium]
MKCTCGAPPGVAARSTLAVPAISLGGRVVARPIAARSRSSVCSSRKVNSKPSSEHGTQRAGSTTKRTSPSSEPKAKGPGAMSASPGRASRTEMSAPAWAVRSSVRAIARRGRRAWPRARSARPRRFQPWVRRRRRREGPSGPRSRAPSAVASEMSAKATRLRAPRSSP